MNFEAKYITLIEDYLMEVENQKSRKILVAFLGGNAALGLPQLDEELVVNYIYIDNRTKKKTVGKTVGMTFHGYPVDNFIEKLSKQNKSCMEMAHSPVVYIGDVDFCRRLSRLSKESFSESKVLTAYWSKNTNPNFQLRRIRNRLSCKWIYEHHTMPPMDFKRLVEATVDDEVLK